MAAIDAAAPRASKACAAWAEASKADGLIRAAELNASALWAMAAIERAAAAELNAELDAALLNKAALAAIWAKPDASCEIAFIADLSAANNRNAAALPAIAGMALGRDAASANALGLLANCWNAAGLLATAWNTWALLLSEA